MSKDPLSLAQDALEQSIKNAPSIKRAMGRAIKNVVAFNKLRGTEMPDVTSENDVPLLMLAPVGGPSNVNFASNLASLDWTWRILVNSGDRRLTEINPIIFAIFATMAHLVDSGADGQLVGLKWNDYPFAKNLTFSSITTGDADPSQNFGIVGWTGVCDLTLHMLFPTTMLRDFNAP